MEDALRILHLEDERDYSDLVRSLLEEDGFTADVTCAQNEAEFKAALARGGFDLVLADYTLPDYNGLQALKYCRANNPDLPFVLVSGTIGEHAAIESLKNGATDYVLKQWSERLAPAVRRVVQEAEERAHRKQAETALIRREKLFRALTDNALDVVSVLNPQGMFQYTSQSVKRMTGYDSAELIGQNAFDFMHPDDRPEVLKKFQQCIQHPELTFSAEFRFRHHDGSWRHVQSVAQSQLDDPAVAGVVVNSRDVTDRKVAEDAVRSSELLFRSVWDKSVDSMWLTDKDGVIVAVNQALCKLVRLSREELVGKPFTTAYAGDQPLEQRLSEYREQFSLRMFEDFHERTLTTKDGRHLVLAATSAFVELPGREPLLLSLFQDVTEQRRMQEHLRHSQKMEAIGMLAGGVAHDFNNILTVVQGHASLLLSGGNLAPDLAASVQQISQAAGRAASLTRQLLMFSRRQVMQLSRVDLNEVVGDLTKMLRRILGEDIAMRLNYSSAPAVVRADVGMVEQVLMNLAVNSRDAMPEGGQLVVTVSVSDIDEDRAQRHPEARLGRFVCLTISDTGSGIAPENLPHIFEPFFTTKEVGKGTGLGLATVYGIVKQHEGWIEVTSEVGQGTTFSVFLPSLTETAEAPAADGD